MRDMRIKFYSKHDLSSGWNLREAESFLQNWDERVCNPDINTILEVYNIKKYFDNDMRLDQWTDDQFEEYKEKCKQIPKVLGTFGSTLSDSNLADIHKLVHWGYDADFWSFICDFKVYKRIGAGALEEMLSSDEHLVWMILQQRQLVLFFGSTIADHLDKNPRTAEKLISHYLEAHDRSDYQLFFPEEFTQERRDRVLAEYVEQEDCNINSLRLLEQAQSTKEFPVSDRLRLKARKKKAVLQEALFARSAGITYGAEVSFKSIPDGSVETSNKNHIVSHAYSREWIEENQDYPTLLNNFIYLFEYVDQNGRCTFLSHKSDLGVLERHMGVKGKKDYSKGTAFNVKRMLSLLQMAAYQQELMRLGIRLEDIFKWFFEDYLPKEFNAIGFTYSPPSAGTTFAEKCKLLAISIDGVLKQYRLFCEDGYVDRELLEMSSGHIVFGDLPSLNSKKYGYAITNDLKLEQDLLFSDQSMMTYTRKTEAEYHTLPQLLLSEKMTAEDFEHYQQPNLNWLMDRGVIAADGEGFLRINTVRACVLKDLFDKDVICPISYNPILLQQVEELVAAGEMKYESTLFSKPEQDYLNYVLNKSEFSNGMDLRNKYSHDTCSLDEETQKQDYLELLKIMVLIVIKINAEFCMKQG